MKFLYLLKSGFLLPALILPVLFFNFLNARVLEIPGEKTGEKIEKLFHEIVDTMPNNPQFSMELIKKADSLANILNEIMYVKKVKLLYAKNNYYVGNYNRSLKYLNECLVLNKQEHDSAYFADVYYIFATNHNYLGNYDSSLYYATEALKIYEALQNTEKVITTNTAIGLSYSKSKNTKMALKSYQKALALAEEIQDKYKMTLALNNIATIYYHLGKYDTASRHYKHSLDIALKTDNKKNIAMINQNLGNIEWINGDFQEALNYYKKALHYDKQLGLAYETSLVLNNIGGLYGVELKDYEKADKYLSEGLYYARKANAKGIIRGIYKAWYDIYMQREDYKTALEYFRKYSDISDSIYNETRAREIARLREDYEAEKREKEIGKLNHENKIKVLENKRQERLIYSIIGFVLFAAIVVLLLFNRFKLRQKHRQTALKMKNLEFEHKMLLSQMNPHFIFNSLGSIQNYYSKNEDEIAENYLLKFSTLIRRVLENSRQNMITFADDVEALRLYIILEQLRFANKFDYDIKIDPDIENENTFVPPMLIQPFAENAIIHGLKNLDKKGKLEISFTLHKEFISCEITDNGIGREKAPEFKKSTVKNKKSLGTEITKERLNLLFGNKEVEDLIIIEDLKDEKGNSRGTKVLVKIPYENE